MRKTPLRLLTIGVVLFAVGFAIGQFNIDPLSAWIGTAGIGIALSAVGWITLERLRRHRRSTQPTSDALDPE